LPQEFGLLHGFELLLALPEGLTIERGSVVPARTSRGNILMKFRDVAKAFLELGIHEIVWIEPCNERLGMFAAVACLGCGAFATTTFMAS